MGGSQTKWGSGRHLQDKRDEERGAQGRTDRQIRARVEQNEGLW